MHYKIISGVMDISEQKSSYSEMKRCGPWWILGIRISSTLKQSHDNICVSLLRGVVQRSGIASISGICSSKPRSPQWCSSTFCWMFYCTTLLWLQFNLWFNKIRLIEIHQAIYNILV